MDVAIGLPNAVPGTTGGQLVEWARRADARGFSSLGTIDRVVYDNYEPLTALAAAAAVTERIGLCTSVLLGPLRPNAAELAKQALSLNALSGGRFTVGIGLGAGGRLRGEWGRPARSRPPARRNAGADQGGLGRRGHLALRPVALRSPRRRRSRGLLRPSGSFWRWLDRRRLASEQFGEMVGKVHEAWNAAGRADEPRTLGLTYFSLGEGAEQNASAYLGDYYGWLGDEVAAIGRRRRGQEKLQTVRQYIAGFDAAGCGELILFPSSSDPDQVDLLADAVGL